MYNTYYFYEFTYIQMGKFTFTSVLLLIFYITLHIIFYGFEDVLYIYTHKHANVYYTRNFISDAQYNIY